MNNNFYNQEKDFQHLLKFIIVGDYYVGKTALQQRYVNDTFNHQHISTIGVLFIIKRINIRQIPVKIQIWDTAGQERFRCISTAYYRNATGILLVFDLNNRESFKNLENWQKQIKDQIKDEQVPIIVVGNKNDLDANVATDEVLDFVQKHGLLYYETSAKTNSNVDVCFETLAVNALDYKIQRDAQLQILKLQQNNIPHNEFKNEKKACCA